MKHRELKGNSQLRDVFELIFTVYTLVMCSKLAFSQKRYLGSATV